ncbi:MAG: GLUG motif-containing protein [Planctomycetota bacterium]|jgi:hypothetical protein
MNSLKKTSRIRTQIKRFLNHMVLLGGVTLIALFVTEGRASGFSGSGSGTEGDPHQITNATQLQEMADDLDAHYVLMNDIDCSDTINWNSGAGFDPVGDNTNQFTGSLDGQDNKIIGLYINRSSIDYVGLFGYTGSGVTVSNVGLEEVDIVISGSSSNNVGGLVGQNDGAITDSHSTGNLSSSNDSDSSAAINNVGGLVGRNIGTITNSHSTVSVSGSSISSSSGSVNCVGGLVGRITGTIADSYSTGDVSGSAIDRTNQNVGGLVGASEPVSPLPEGSTIINSYSTGDVSANGTITYRSSLVAGLIAWNSGTIKNSYSTGNVSDNNIGSGISCVGGLAGQNLANLGKIINSYSTGSVSGGSNSYYSGVGGLVGVNYSTITNCYWNNHAGNPSVCIGGGNTGDCTGIVDNESYFYYSSDPPMDVWDFVNVWGIDEGVSYPCLCWQGCCVLSVAIDIKPGSYPNAINLGSHGLIPVAMLSSDQFDATTVDPDTVELAGAGVAMRGKSNKYMAHQEDVNGDGLVDLVVQVATENLNAGSFQDGYAILTAETLDGQPIEGADEIAIVPEGQ